jgi:CRP-like cAMP-binding protein
MDPAEQLKLLKSVRLLDQIPERQLAALAGFLRPVDLMDGAVIFEEGAKGDSLYFVTRGQVRISKKVSGASKDLAILGPGDCFGEMALVEEVARSAGASACGPTSLFQLGRSDMKRWLKEHPALAVDFFTELVLVQSKRLRRTSTELTLLFDLSNLLLENLSSGKELLAQVLDRLVPHLEGAWSASASLYNIFNEEMEPAAGLGSFDFAALASKLPPPTETRSVWIGPGTYYVSLPGAKRPLGFLVFHSEDALTEEERTELGRTLTTVARLLTSALENIEFRTEESLRARLKTKSYGAGI